MGRTVGEGSFGKVKHARHRGTGAHFAVKILDRARILALRIDDQVPLPRPDRFSSFLLNRVRC
ncbi:hypothetical protein PR202_gb24964 [Eleusine coracana subsp. coracana]|uniref:Uncharacterized protein n=1 Tax=Eleusine coracana subsp. coracana TaxID=191504 RepID=A0AAV5FN12_ELECO|nr:hypothetical protein PR202_gb24964 [Eleusine coracana subsp. coracana]